LQQGIGSDSEETQLFVDTDNALGSRRGDVDDAFAIAALLCGGAPVAAISSCDGNTDEASAFANNVRLCELLAWHGPLLRGSEARERLRSFRGRILALGPLTNVAGAAAAREVIVVGGRMRAPWHHEFNLTRDPAASRRVFESPLPLTFFPLDVAERLRVPRSALDAIGGELGVVLRRESAHWFRHLRLRLTRLFPIFDLAAALYALGEKGFAMEDSVAAMSARGVVRIGKGTRPVRICAQLNAPLLWERFLRRTARESRPR